MIVEEKKKTANAATLTVQGNNKNILMILYHKKGRAHNMACTKEICKKTCFECFREEPEEIEDFEEDEIEEVEEACDG